MRISKLAVLALAVLALAEGASAYPLDAAEATGIQRLEAARLTQSGSLPGRQLPAGALLPRSSIGLRLAGHPELMRPAPDAALGAALKALTGSQAGSYGIALLDLSDLAHPVYAEHRGEAPTNPGSVGKLLIALSLFQTLADLYPGDYGQEGQETSDPRHETSDSRQKGSGSGRKSSDSGQRKSEAFGQRERILRETRVRADSFIQTPSHEVPIWRPGDPRVVRRKLRLGDEANLWTFLDWMLSASSNAAASMVLQQAMLLQHFGAGYPAGEVESRQFLEATPRAELSSKLIDLLQQPVSRNGLDPATLRQGGFFTSEAKRRVPGSTSVVTPRALIDFLMLMEQGRLVDEFSSLELKRLLYMTDRRIRYASSPALADAAVYTKSGSLYRCAPEPGFECRKYHGNVENRMNSITIVESPAAEPRLFYMVAVTSNVLRRNSAEEHQSLATRIHQIIRARHPVATQPSGGA